MTDPARPLRFGQFSAYYGDRNDTFDELLASGVQVLTGDYLAELTMLILKKNELRGGDGYATGFVRQMETALPQIAAHGARVVTNAGGLDPQGCASAIREVVTRLGLDLTVAAITGDDIHDQLETLAASGQEFRNFDSGLALDIADQRILTANAYLGAWPIVDALKGGADIVICPRVTDASLVMGPAAWHFGWSHDDLDQLAGALWAGHAIECGAQVTGGNYSFFYEHKDLGVPGMPIADVFADGSSIIGKAEGTGGVVTVDTVKAQLLYEVNSPLYQNPDVIADLRSLDVQEVGPDLVRISGATGFAPSDQIKLSLCYEGGYRNSMIIGLTGGHIEEKVTWLRQQVETVLGGFKEFTVLRWTVIGPSADPTSIAGATAWLIVTGRASNRERVGKDRFAQAITQLGVSSIPGFYLGAPPQRERLAGVQWPCLLPKECTTPSVHFGDGRVIDSPWPSLSNVESAPTDGYQPRDGAPEHASDGSAPTRAVALGDVFGTRSGDKAGLANLGVWGRSPESFAWLRQFLNVAKLKELIPDLRDLRIDRYEIPGLYGLNFVAHAYLEDGAGTSTSIDTQAKGLGEFLGSQIVDIPVAALVGNEG